MPVDHPPANAMQPGIATIIISGPTILRWRAKRLEPVLSRGVAPFASGWPQCGHVAASLETSAAHPGHFMRGIDWHSILSPQSGSSTALITAVPQAVLWLVNVKDGLTLDLVKVCLFPDERTVALPLSKEVFDRKN